ncbi:unnamed protein product, partial [Polarella glacialis]
AAPCWGAGLAVAGCFLRAAWGRQRRGLNKRSRSAAVSQLRATSSAKVQDGDVIAVVGAGGNVGRLVTQCLCASGRFRVRAVMRDAERARSSWARDLEGLELFEADTRDASSLAAALSEANAVVCTTGVPAFGISGQWKDGNHPES